VAGPQYKQQQHQRDVEGRDYNNFLLVTNVGGSVGIPAVYSPMLIKYAMND